MGACRYRKIFFYKKSTAHAYGITQCYLPPGRGDIPALTPAVAGTRLSDPGGMQGSVDLLGLLHIFAPSLHTLYRVIPTKWRSYRDHRFCVTSPHTMYSCISPTEAPRAATGFQRRAFSTQCRGVYGLRLRSSVFAYSATPITPSVRGRARNDLRHKVLCPCTLCLCS